jgi:diguanylate cyclase (GGDEF)-like protein
LECFDVPVASVAEFSESLTLCLSKYFLAHSGGVMLYDQLTQQLKTIYATDAQSPSISKLPKLDEVLFDDVWALVPIVYHETLLGIIYLNQPNQSRFHEYLAAFKVLIQFIGLKFHYLLSLHDYQIKSRLINEHIIYFSVSNQGDIIDISDELLVALGYQSDHKAAITLEHLLAKNVKDLAVNWQRILMQSEIPLRKKSGETLWVKSRLVPAHDVFGEQYGSICLQQDITEQKNIELLAIHDALTNLYNRHYFNEVFAKQVHDAQRYKLRQSFILIDIDNFKKYNDTYGHHAGDEALGAVAKAIKSCFRRDGDFVFRLGGEEVGVLCRVIESDDAAYLADMARQAVMALDIEHTGNAPFGCVTISSGVYVMEPGGLVLEPGGLVLEPEDIYKTADIALYKAKERGRNRVEVAGAEDDVELF